MRKKACHFVLSLLILIMLLPISPASAELPQANRLIKRDHISPSPAEQRLEDRIWTQLPDGVSPAAWQDIRKRVSEDVNQQAYLKASNTDADDRFGFSVAVSGDTLVIGATREDSDADSVIGDQGDNQALFAGAAYVFVRSGNEWTYQAYLKASNSNWGDYFGFSVAISGDTIVVGAPYEDSSATTVNGDQEDNSVEEAGAAYVFVREGDNWNQQAYLKPDNTGYHDCFAQSVDISGDTIVVGSTYEDGESTEENYDEGAAYVFKREGATWSQQAYLKASNAGEGDYFGNSVAISGDSIVVGAPYEVDEGVHYGGAA